VWPEEGSSCSNPLRKYEAGIGWHCCCFPHELASVNIVTPLRCLSSTSFGPSELCKNCVDHEYMCTKPNSPSLMPSSLQKPSFLHIRTHTHMLLCRGLQQGFRDEVFGAPPSLPPNASAGQVVEKLQKLLDIMVSRGYALKVGVCTRVCFDGACTCFYARVW